jgi:hypothetical protein
MSHGSALARLERQVQMTPPQLRIFPHDPKTEFPSEETLVDWLLNDLRNQGGLYRLRHKRIKDLRPGSIILFQYRKAIIGEAVVKEAEKKLDPPVKETTKAGVEVEYNWQITVAPWSVRVYDHPVPLKKIQPHTKTDLLAWQGAYPRLPWRSYGYILEEAVGGETTDARHHF